MKIALSAQGPEIKDQVDPRFGRCAWFHVVDIDSGKSEVIENVNAAAGGGAGINSAQMMVDKGASVVLTGNCGPNAFRVFDAAGVKIYAGVSGSVADAIERFKSGALDETKAANVQEHFGTGMGKKKS